MDSDVETDKAQNTHSPNIKTIVDEGLREVIPSPPRRRSARLIKPCNSSVTTSSSSVITMSEPRRNPKRKAGEPSTPVKNLPDNLLEEALAPLTATDIEEWEGWIELESEPAFFDIILRDLGVQNVKAQEIFSIDQGSLDMLPQPVFGLIFCFQYLPGSEVVEQDENVDGVWFANQTTSNACATVAMLNIIMNASDVELGDNLRDFKESTRDLPTALRGHQLSKNVFIRKTHNSFTRRMDHLNADLILENDASDAKSRSAKKRAAPRKGTSSRTPSKKKRKPEYGFHFIAYVPAGGYVWELDGLSQNPHKLDEIPEGDWTSVARPQIEARIMQYEEGELSFNLLALCPSPLLAYSQSIARNLAALLYLHSHMSTSQPFTELIAAEENPLALDDDTQLETYNLKRSDIDTAKVPETLRDRISAPDFDVEKAHALHAELVTEVKATMGEYRAELMSIADEERRVKGRKKDYGPALHRWVTSLAEKAVLEDVIKNSS